MRVFSFFVLAAGFVFLTGCDEKDPAPPGLKADFFVTGFENPLPATINFVNNSTNATSYLWDFGDGTTSTEQGPTHVYTLPGTYQLKLTATGPTGSKTVCRVISLETLNPNASAFTYYFDRCEGAPVGAIFKTLNPASGNYYWSFNGTVNTTKEPIVQFPLPGDYTIKYSTVINGVRDTVTRIIQIQ
jgi:PKD repeat protein